MTGAAAAARPFPDIADEQLVKPKVRVNGFDFDSRNPIPAEKPYRDISSFQYKLIMHILAMNVSLLGVKAMVFVAQGGFKAVIMKAAWWLFWPLLSIL